MNNLLLSVVIPVYNVEHLVHKCVQSLLDNLASIGDTSEVEIVFVNDGSSDNSMAIIEGANWNGFVPTIVNQANAGQSSARNKGTALAQGKYVWYLDSDDWIEKDAFVTVLGYIKNNDVDVFSIGFTHLKEDGQILYKTLPQEADKPYKILNNDFASLVWSFLFKRTFLEAHKASFIEGVYHEDVEFLVKVMYMATSIKAIPKNLYFYLKREGSTTMNKNYNPKRADDIFVVVKSLSAFKKQDKTRPELWRVSFMIARTLTSILKDVPNMTASTLEKVKTLFKENRQYTRHFLDSGELKYRILGVLLYVMPSYYISSLSRSK
jgi:glycosyltransferase involved in cell wall biosynthesis